MLYIILILILIGLDQLSKYLIATNMNIHDSIKLIENFFYITYVRNDGAGFSILSGQRYLLILVSLIAACVFVYFLYKSKDKIEKLLCSFIIAGALGNLSDRLFYGSVVDFLDFKILGYDYPVFNVADIFITVGIILYIIYLYLHDRKVIDDAN